MRLAGRHFACLAAFGGLVLLSLLVVLGSSGWAEPRHHRGLARAGVHAARARAAQQAVQQEAAHKDAAHQRLLAAQTQSADDLAAQRQAAIQVAGDAARAAALSAQARDAAAHLRDIERHADDLQSRVEALGARRVELQRALAHEAAALAPMLPLIVRLSMFPAETLLGSSATPADTLSGLMVLRALGTQLEARARAIRVRQKELGELTASLEEQRHRLASVREEQMIRGEQVSAEAERAAATQRASGEAADAASRAAAVSAARAANLQDAVGRIEAAERSAQALFQREAAAADRASKPDIARSARLDAATVSTDSRPGPAPGDAGAAPVAGKLVQLWGAATDAGPATGITYAPPAMAVVTAPCDGRIDFAGPFRSYGKMLILDCGHSYRFVLAGLERLDVAIGQKLSKGVAIGRMPDWNPAATSGRPSLYVQLRHGSQAIDPGSFLRSHS